MVSILHFGANSNKAYIHRPRIYASAFIQPILCVDPSIRDSYFNPNFNVQQSHLNNTNYDTNQPTFTLRYDTFVRIMFIFLYFN